MKQLNVEKQEEHVVAASEIDKMKVDELRKVLKDRDLRWTGLKKVLQDRLKNPSSAELPRRLRPASDTEIPTIPDDVLYHDKLD